MAEEGGAQKQDAAIVEQLVAIGYNAEGKLAAGWRGDLNPAVVPIILEQVRNTLIARFRFQREGMIDVVPGAALGALNGKGV
jgi:hypothetical protein